MKPKNIPRHCNEVEKLMGGKMPFVTRYGITLVVFALIIIAIILLFSKGEAQHLMKEMVEHTKKQIMSKI